MTFVNKISIALQVIMLSNKSVCYSHCCDSWECDSKHFYKSIANHSNSFIVSEQFNHVVQSRYVASIHLMIA